MENSAPHRSSDTSVRPGLRWLWRMAWRDSRGHRKKLLLFAMSVVFGIAALVAIGSVRQNITDSINAEAGTLLGSDLQIISQRSFSPEAEAMFEGLGEESTREISFNSMALFPGTGRTRLSSIHAFTEGFPFYGDIDTVPEGVPFRGTEEPVALVERALLEQMGAEPGDIVKLGEVEFTIGASLLKVPGQSDFMGFVAPRVLIDMEWLDDTGLMRRGSLTQHTAHFRFEDGFVEDDFTDEQEAVIDADALRVETIEERKEELGEGLENLYRFLNLVGFVALLLGGVGMAGAVQIYLKDKLTTVAVLRCLGAANRQAFGIYLAQVSAVALGAAVVGGLLGLAAQFGLPVIIEEFLPFDLSVALAPASLLNGMGFGLLITVIFALVPLLAVRRVSPLSAIRLDYEGGSRRKDPLFWVTLLLAGAVVVAFCRAQTESAEQALGFAAFLFGSLAVLALVAHVLRLVLRKTTRGVSSFAWRQGLANLHRPNNRTLFLTTTLGMGMLLVFGIHVMQDLLLNQLREHEIHTQANLFFYDIQDDQLPGVGLTLAEQKIPVLETAPIVTMRIAEVKGRTVQELREDRGARVRRRALNWEYRSTYRSELTESETLLEGEWIPEWDETEPIPISVERERAEDLNVGLGDTITFDVQGLPVETVVHSIRAVDWAQARTNFFVVFPSGSLIEEAPQFHVILARSPSPAATATTQRLVAERFSNVSSVDIGLIVRTLKGILDKITFAVQFMALFTIVTGIIVLTGAIVTSRYQRVRESVLLRTLGASSGQVRRILCVEFVLLGLIGGLAGVGLSLIGVWLLTNFLFAELVFSVDPWSVPIALAIMAALTLVTGLLNSRGISNHPPLEVLRREV